MADEVLGGYRLLKHMVTGQTSQVWEVVEGSSHRHFAMKMLLPEKARDREHRNYLFHEAEVGQQLAHPNIIRIVAVNKTGDTPYIVMEFFPAGNLKLRIMRRRRCKKKTGREGPCFLTSWRRERDSNPRGAINPHTLSRRAT